jgi:uncharacterized protein YbjT (DUF2867 family)
MIFILPTCCCSAATHLFLISFQDAGSAEVFRKVDHDYVAAAAAAKAAGVPYFGLVSVQGAMFFEHYA